MNNDQVNSIIQGLGAMVEMWTIVYNKFKQQGFDDASALSHTTAFMSITIASIVGNDNKEDKHDPS